METIIEPSAKPKRHRPRQKTYSRNKIMLALERCYKATMISYGTKEAILNEILK